MLKDEFKRVMQLFHEAAEGKKIDLEEVFAQSLLLFEHLKDQIAQGSQEDRMEAMRMMSEMYTQMIKETKKITETSGMTEEQLIAFADDPANYSVEQWNAIQASKERIRHAGKDLAASLEKSIHTKPPSPEEKKPKNKKFKKSDWMRS